MVLGQTALVLIGLVLAGWTLAAIAAILAARKRQRKAEAGLKAARRLSRMIDESPALPLLVRADGRIEAPQRLANWLGLDRSPEFLSELDAGDRGLDAETLAALSEAVKHTQKTAGPLSMTVTPRGGNRSLALRGHLADPQVSPGGSALIWVFDISESEHELVALREETARAKADFAGLVALIEAAPMPMWFRAPDGRLRLVNSAYVEAIDAESAESAIAAGSELIEPVDGRSPRDFAMQAAEKGEQIERNVPVTVDGERRTFRVTDLPVPGQGVAGYAVDIEDMDALRSGFEAFRTAQRGILDALSAGIGQFDAERRLVFANQPFQRLFAIASDETESGAPGFEQVLDGAREEGRVPEVRDFPEWRREKAAWFSATGIQEEAWPLPDGSHLRIVAMPLPDGGLVLVAEDRTEHLRLSAMRDTLLRTRAATFDSLSEAVAVFSPDGRLQLWNRRFASEWAMDDELLDTHPHVNALLERIAPRLRSPSRIKVVGDVVRAATLDRRTEKARIALADGRVYALGGVPLPDGNGLLTILDITAAQKAQAALKERNEALTEADAIKTRFLATMSYELRTPLTSIGGFAELLDAGAGGELTEAGNEYVDAILASVATLGEQIESLLDLSQSEAGMLPLAEETVDLAAMVRTLLDDRAARLDAAGLALDLRGADIAGLSITGDKRRLTRALGHLLDNSIAATDAGGRILVQLSAEEKQTARVVISDNGRGMDAKELARAMEGIDAPATQSGAPRQRIGLPLARQLIEAHGGSLQLLSEPGQGTAAIVDLPRNK